MRFSFWNRTRFKGLLVGAGLLSMAAGTVQAQSSTPGSKCCPPPCPTPPSYVTPPGTVPPRTDTPAPVPPRPAPDAAIPDLSGLAPEGAQALGGATRAFTPNMKGDLLYGSRSVFFSYQRSAGDITIAGSGATSVVNPKIADNNSPIPRDRLSFRYNYFHNALSVTGVSSDPAVLDPALGFRLAAPATRSYNADLYTFGVEKTFLDGRASIELRVPFQTTLASKLDLSAGSLNSVGPGTDDLGNPILGVSPTPGNTLGREATEWGNLNLILKGLISSSECWAFTGGLGIGIPTGPDARVRVTDFLGRVTGPAGFQTSIARGREFHIKNETWSLSPFLAALTTPTDRLFAQGFLQFELPVNRSRVTYAEGTTEPGFRVDPAVPDIIRQVPGVLVPPFRTTRRIEEQALMHMDLGVGYWVVRDQTASWITGIAPAIELHYTTALENADIVTLPRDPSLRTVTGQFTPEPAPQVGNRRNRVDFLNLTLGNTVEIANRATLATGIVLPLRRESDRTFDWEFQLQFNYYFGGPRSRPNSAF